MYYGVVEDGYKQWVGKHHKSISAYAQLFVKDYCKEDPLDVIADCEVEHSIVILDGVEDWQTKGTSRQNIRYDTSTGVIAGGTIYALVLLFAMGYFIVWDGGKYKTQ
jgi:hypothetical protein